MPLTRKQQILFKRETSEGQNASPGASDAVLVYEPSISDDPETNRRTPAGSSLSRAIIPVGRKTRTITFQSDFRGSGDSTAPVTEPDWGVLLECSAFEKVQPRSLAVSSVTGTGYHLGEIVRKDSTKRGVILGLFDGSGNLVHRLAGSGTVVVAPLEGTIDTTGTLTGESSGTTGTIGTVGDYAGWAYRPTSEKLIRLQTGGWSSDPGLGDVITILASGVQVGLAQIVATNGSFADMDVVLLDGTVANGNDLEWQGESATINAAPTMTKTPSATIRHNLDGRRRDLVGARGSFELQADAGNPLVFSWTFQGDPATAADALPVATSGLSSVRAPRLFGADGAICSFARTVSVPGGDDPQQILRLPTKSVSLASGNQIAPDLDANSEGGSRGSNVTDREPTLGYTVSQVHSGFDWEAFRDQSLPVHTATIVGKTKGNIVGLVCPNGQVLQATIGDSNGVANFEVQIQPSRILEQGDDELFLFQL